MTIYDALKKDHKKVEALLEKLVESSEAGTDDWKRIVEEIRDELIPHARAEEAVFYNAIRESHPDKGPIIHAYTEHAKAEAELRALQAMKSIDVNWKALAKKLRDDILLHIRDEEEHVFAAAKEAFSVEEAKMIAKAFIELKPSIKEQGLAGTTMDLVANLLPSRFTEGFRKYFGTEHKRSA